MHQWTASQQQRVLAIELGRVHAVVAMDSGAQEAVPGTQYPVPEELKSLFAGLGVEPSMWCDLVWNYKKYFGTSRCSGRPQAMMADAQRVNKAWSRGQRQAAACFA